jgi:hypothetical protein
LTADRERDDNGPSHGSTTEEDTMTRLTICVAAAALTAIAGTAAAQVTKTIQGEMKTVTASVEAIERASREVTLKKPDGTFTTVRVPDGVKRFDTLKIGDKITARYYDNIVLNLKAPGEKAVDSGSAAVTRASDNRAAATMATQRTITATITNIDPNVPSITFSGPNGWSYSSRVQDTKTLAKVKVGDKVDITWTEALLVSLDEGK